MTQTVLLDNTAHKDLRVRTGYSAEFGDSISQVHDFLQNSFTCSANTRSSFARTPADYFSLWRCLASTRRRTCFWKAARGMPGMYRLCSNADPFLIGFRTIETSGEAVREPVIHIDLDHPRVSKTEGEPVFLKHGGNAPYLERANRMLQLIYRGTSAVRPMFAAFEEAGILESMEIEVALDDRVKYKLPGFLTISEPNLAKLDGAQLERLNKTGFLHFAMFALASLGNINWLIELKNRKRAEAAMAGEPPGTGASPG
jgi:hypothetical protein